MNGVRIQPVNGTDSRSGIKLSRKEEHDIKIDGAVLTLVDYYYIIIYQILGKPFDVNSKRKEHIEYVSKKCKRMLIAQPNKKSVWTTMLNRQD